MEAASQHNCIEALKNEIARIQLGRGAKCDEYVKGFDIKKVCCGECNKQMLKIHKNPYSSAQGNPRCDVCADSELIEQAF